MSALNPCQVILQVLVIFMLVSVDLKIFFIFNIHNTMHIYGEHALFHFMHILYSSYGKLPISTNI